jgi:N-acetylglucosamine-6-phosphate deacetylase
VNPKTTDHAMTTRLQGCILTPDGWVRGTLVFQDRIDAVDGEAVAAPGDGERLVLPGFIDLHVHGGGGADVMDGDGAIDTIARLHARHGTTSLLATTMTAPRPTSNGRSPTSAAPCRERPDGGARVLGAHLEGPFLNPASSVRSPHFARVGTIEESAPACAGADPRADAGAGSGRPSRLHPAPAHRRHRAADRPQQRQLRDGVAALDAGARGFTHLFNAMSELHHRKPGMVGAALAHAEYSEIIPDLLHVHPGAIRAARRAIPKLYCVTDSTAGAGMPDGNYRLGSHTVTKCLGGVRLADGTLAGSVLTMDQAFRNLVTIGIPPHDAARHVSTHPADYSRRARTRAARAGAHADVVVLSPDLQLLATYVEGECIELAHA